MRSPSKCAVTALQWTLGMVVLVEAILFVMPSAHHEFARTHMPDFLREVLGWGEIAGAVLFLFPKTVIRGAWLLIAVFALAIAVHLLHGMWNVGNLLIYMSAAWVVADAKEV